MTVVTWWTGRRVKGTSETGLLIALVTFAAILTGCTPKVIRPAPAPSIATSPSAPAAPPVSPPKSRPTDAELLALPDAIPVAEQRALLGNPPSYTALGQRYTVLAESRGFVERGVASWYGPDFHGERTSVGEPYNMYAMTAAHRTLPLPAYARITNLKNGRSVVVRINDRGPFKSNRIVDLSYTAALKLDMLREGTTMVELRVLEPARDAPPPPKPAPVYAQAGAFAVEDNATRLEQKLIGAGITEVVVRHDRVNDRDLYRVRIGPVASVSDYDQLVQRLARLGVAHITLAPN